LIINSNKNNKGDFLVSEQIENIINENYNLKLSSELNGKKDKNKLMFDNRE